MLIFWPTNSRNIGWYNLLRTFTHSSYRINLVEFLIRHQYSVWKSTSISRDNKTMSTFDHVISKLPCHYAFTNDQISNAPTHASCFRQKKMFLITLFFFYKMHRCFIGKWLCKLFKQTKLIWFYNTAIEILRKSVILQSLIRL